MKVAGPFAAKAGWEAESPDRPLPSGSACFEPTCRALVGCGQGSYGQGSYGWEELSGRELNDGGALCGLATARRDGAVQGGGAAHPKAPLPPENRQEGEVRSRQHARPAATEVPAPTSQPRRPHERAAPLSTSPSLPPAVQMAPDQRSQEQVSQGSDRGQDTTATA